MERGTDRGAVESSGDVEDDDGQMPPGEGTSTGTDSTSTGDTPPDVPAFEAGGRLRPIVERNDDGDERLARWFDVELDTDCYVSAGPEGQLSCRPLQEVSAGMTFADASCSTLAEAVHDASCQQSGGFVSTYRCNRLDRTFRRGEPVGEVYWRGADGECMPLGTTGHVLELVEDEMFVGGTIVAVSSGGSGLNAGRLMLADGASAIAGLMLDEDVCDLVEVDQHATCFPDTLVRSFGYDYFPDASCDPSSALASDFLGQEMCEVPSYGFDVLTQTAAVVDGAFDGAAYDSFSGACEPADPNPLRRLFTTSPLELDELESVPVVVSGDGRLQPRAFQTSTSVTSLDYTWYDRELDFVCGYEDSASGGLCAPVDSTFFAPDDAFADPGCGNPLVRVTGTVPSFAHHRVRSGCISMLSEVVRLGAVHEGPTYQIDGSGACVESSSSSNYATIVESIALDDLAALTRQVQR